MKKRFIFYFVLLALAGIISGARSANAQTAIAVGTNSSAGYSPGIVKFFDWFSSPDPGCVNGPSGFCLGPNFAGDTYFWTGWLPNATGLPVPTGLPVVGTINDYTFGNICGGNIGLLQLDTFSWSTPSASHITKVNCLQSFGVGGADTNHPVGWLRMLTSGDASGQDGTWKNRQPFSRGGILYLPVERQISSGDPSTHDATFIMSPDSGQHWCNPYTYFHHAGSPGCDSSNWQANGDAPVCGAAVEGGACTDSAYLDPTHSSIMWHALPFGTENWYWINYGYQDGMSPPAGLPNDGCDPSTYACFYLEDGSLARTTNVMDVSAWQYYTCPTITQSYRCPGSDPASWTSNFGSRTPIRYWSWYGGPFQNQIPIMYTTTYMPEFKSYLMTAFNSPDNFKYDLLWAPTVEGPWTLVYQQLAPGYPGAPVQGLAPFPSYIAANPALGYTVLSTNPPHVQMTISSNNYEDLSGAPLFGLWDLVAGDPNAHIGGANYQFGDSTVPGVFPGSGVVWSFDFLDQGVNSTFTTWPFFVDGANKSAVMVPCDGAFPTAYTAPYGCGNMNLSHGTSMNVDGIKTSDTVENYGGHFRTAPGEMAIGGVQNAPSAMQGNGSYSVVGVYRLDGNNMYGRTAGIWSTGVPSGTDNTMVELNQTGGRLELDWNANFQPHYQYLSNFTFPNFNNWYFVAVTVQAQTGCGSSCVPTAKIWVGDATTPGVVTDMNAGVPYTNTPGAAAGTMTPNVQAGPLVLGMNGHGDQSSMSYASLMVYNRALTQTEVQATYQTMIAKMAQRGVVLGTATTTTADTTPPTATISSPAQNATLSGTTASVSVSASDNVGVSRVELSVDSVLKLTDTTSPYAFSLDTTALSNGSHTLSARAYDAAGNVGTSPSVQVTVSNNQVSAVPIISSFSALPASTAPGQGSILSWVVSGATSLSLDNGFGSQPNLTSGYVGAYPFQTTTYTLTAANAQGTSNAQTTITVTGGLASDTTPPTAFITSPSSGTVSGTITLSATASDPTVSGQVTSGLFQLLVAIDGTTYATSTTGSLSVPLTTTTLGNGTHAITATAKDNAGNTFTTTPVTIIVNNVSSQKYPRLVTLSGLEGLSFLPTNEPITVTVLSTANGSTLETETPTPNAFNQYTVSFQGSDPQLVNIRIKAAGYLSQLLSNVDTTVNSPSALPVPQLVAGDLNNDNAVNSLDYSLMNSHWLQNFSAADVNGDGLVNSLDFAILKNDFGKGGQ